METRLPCRRAVTKTSGMPMALSVSMMLLLSIMSVSGESFGAGLTSSDGSAQCDRAVQRFNGPAGMNLQAQRCLQRIKKNITDSLNPYVMNFPGKIALFDVATHHNVGDNLLWKGALDMMHNAMRSPDILCSGSQSNTGMQGRNFPTCGSPAATLTKLGSPALILWQAGGNFGDLWPTVQSYRMRMILEFDQIIETDEAFRDFKLTIIQLPQSVFYTDKAIQDREAEGLRNLKHVRFILTTRATPSYMIAVNEMKLPNVLAVPDIACASGPFVGSETPIVDIVVLPRSDREAQVTPDIAQDYLRQKTEAAGLTFKLEYYVSNYNNPVNRPQPMASAVSAVRVASGINIITQGQVVITNLMHTAVMSILSGRPVFFWDGGVQPGYNKVGGMFGMMKSASGCSEEVLKAFYFASNNETDDMVRATDAAVAYIQRMPCKALE